MLLLRFGCLGAFVFISFHVDLPRCMQPGSSPIYSAVLEGRMSAQDGPNMLFDGSRLKGAALVDRLRQWQEYGVCDASVPRAVAAVDRIGMAEWEELAERFVFVLLGATSEMGECFCLHVLHVFHLLLSLPNLTATIVSSSAAKISFRTGHFIAQHGLYSGVCRAQWQEAQGAHAANGQACRGTRCTAEQAGGRVWKRGHL